LENSAFATNFDLLAVGSLTGAGTTATTSVYNYTLTGATDTTMIVAAPRDAALKGYSGAGIRSTNGESQSVIGFVACESLVPGVTIVQTAALTCPDTSKAITY
jgi:Type IV pilin-like G and H, putative